MQTSEAKLQRRDLVEDIVLRWVRLA
jgi:hypothetical protein